MAPLADRMAASHGALMVFGLVGTVIVLERAVAITKCWAVTAGVALDPVTAGVGAASVTALYAVTVASGEVTELTVTMFNMRFSPSSLTVPAGDRLELTVTNDDTVVPDLTLANG